MVASKQLLIDNDWYNNSRQSFLTIHKIISIGTQIEKNNISMEKLVNSTHGSKSMNLYKRNIKKRYIKAYRTIRPGTICPRTIRPKN